MKHDEADGSLQHSKEATTAYLTHSLTPYLFKPGYNLSPKEKFSSAIGMVFLKNTETLRN